MAKTFESKIPKDEKNLLVVDALNLAFRWKHKGQLLFKEDYLRTIESLANSYNCNKLIITSDFGNSVYRKELYPEYKENRKELIAKQTEKEKEDFNLFFQEFEETLEYIAPLHLILRYKGVEADDLAGYIVKHRAKYDVDHIWLISSDKDWDCLIANDVSRWSYITRKEIRHDEWPYPVHREEYISWKALMGDIGDNIMGIPKVGPVKAAELIKKYGSALNVYDACPIESKYKYIQSVNEHCERIITNINLMDLLSFCEDAIGPENLEHLDSTVLEYLSGSS